MFVLLNLFPTFDLTFFFLALRSPYLKAGFCCQFPYNSSLDVLGGKSVRLLRWPSRVAGSHSSDFRTWVLSTLQRLWSDQVGPILHRMIVEDGLVLVRP